MQPTPPTSSDAQPAPDAAVAPEAGSEPIQEASQTNTNWFQRLWRRGAEESKSEDQPESPPESSERLVMTREEFQKAVQAENDRREAKRANEAKAAEKKRLRDTDPYAYADLDRAEEQFQSADQQVTSLLGNIGAEYDKYALDPIVLALPEAERKRILELEGAGRGLDGRKLIVSEALKALETTWKSEGAKDAEAKLRRNPAFRKQLLNEIRRGGREPDFIVGGAPSAADQSVSNILREQLRLRH